jgi:nicotinamidase-related amidase
MEVVVADDSALLIIDVQRALCEGAYAAFDIDAVIDRINLLSAGARRAGRPVMLVQHEEADGPMLHDTEGWDLADTLLTATGDLRLRKTASDAFHATPLAGILEARGIRHLVICGLQSEFCIDSTVRGALSRGYRVTLVRDGHSTLDNDVLAAAQIIAHHNATLENLGGFGPRAQVIPADGIRWAA